MDNQSLFPEKTLIESNVIDNLYAIDKPVLSLMDVNKSLGTLTFIKKIRSNLYSSKMKLHNEIDEKYESTFSILDEIEKSIRSYIESYIIHHFDEFEKTIVDDFTKKSIRNFENGKIEIITHNNIKITSAFAQKGNKNEN